MSVSGEALALEQLERAQRDFLMVIDSIPDGVGVMRADRLVYVNAALAASLGAGGPEELLGTDVFDLLHPEEARVVRGRLARIESGVAVPPPRVTRFVRRDGSEAALEITPCGLIDYQGAASLLFIARDLTEHDRMAGQLQVSERMASMGMLAAGVAHEINNPLSAVLMNIEAMMDGLQALPLDDPCRWSFAEPIADAHAASERVRDIVRDLKLFSRSDDVTLGPLDPQQVMESTLRMAWNEVRHRARLVRDYQAAPAVQANESRLGQVFLNLVVNAAQAIPDGRAGENEIRVTIGTDPRGWACIEISDTGQGMTPEVQRRLFTPFFTTKPVGVGTGLGLSIVRRTVASLGGEVTVESAPGKGTTFRLFLPACPSRTEPRPPSPLSPLPATRRGSILLVDDDRLVARSLARSLASEHDLLVETDADAALERLRRGDRFDIILCDVMMPRSTGPELASAIERIDPAQAGRIVFLTGGPFSVDTREALAKLSRPILEKPVDSAALRTLVNELVERG